jgi:hypothetical protein
MCLLSGAKRISASSRRTIAIYEDTPPERPPNPGFSELRALELKQLSVQLLEVGSEALADGLLRGAAGKD